MKRKKLKDLKKYFGILKGDKEYDKISKEIKANWARWTKKAMQK